MTHLLTRLFRPFTSMTTPSAPEPLNIPAGASRASLAAGCFWGVEHLFRQHFGPGSGLLDARVGYVGGHTSAPTYRAVCAGSTGHAEAVMLVFEPEKLAYREILEFFYKIHDPTTVARQGPDVGTQYRSAIFTWSDEQEKVAREVTEKVGKQWWKQDKVVTEIEKGTEWWDAEAYHQRYLDINPGGYECPSHFLRKFPPLT